MNTLAAYQDMRKERNPFSGRGQIDIFIENTVKKDAPTIQNEGNLTAEIDPDKLKEMQQFLAQATTEEIEENIEQQGNDYWFKLGDYKIKLETEVTTYEGAAARWKIAGYGVSAILGYVGAVAALAGGVEAATLGSYIAVLGMYETFATSTAMATIDTGKFIAAIEAYSKNDKITCTTVFFPGTPDEAKNFLSLEISVN